MVHEKAFLGRRRASRRGFRLPGGQRKSVCVQKRFCPCPVSPQEYECLEQENTMLRREIGKLTEELKHLSEALKEHEKMCPLLLCSMNFVPVPRPDPVASCLPR